MRLKPEHPLACDNLLYTLHFHPAYSVISIQDEHRRWDRLFVNPCGKSSAPTPINGIRTGD